MSVPSPSASSRGDGCRRIHGGERGHLSDLHPQLRRRERRRRRRPRRHPRQTRYLRDLGVDAIWISPWYPSPMADAGYDVADYRDIDPVFGTLAEAEALIAEAHDHGLRVMLDIVPNHCSDRILVPRGAGRRARLGRAGPVLVPAGRGVNGDGRPTTGSRTSAARPGPGSRARRHAGAVVPAPVRPEQPDFNWENPEVREDFETPAVLVRPRRGRLPDRCRGPPDQGGRLAGCG